MSGSVFGWTVKFKLPSIQSNVSEGLKCYSDIVNWVNENKEPVAFLSVRGGLDKKSMEFGYYNPDSEEWITSFSPLFDFTSGKYKITCKAELSNITLRLYINGKEINHWHIEQKKYNKYKVAYPGDIVKNRYSDIQDFKLIKCQS